MTDQPLTAADRAHLAHAVRLSDEGWRRGDGGPFGAVVVRDGEVIGEGNNRVVADHDPTAHAEVVAIRRACAAIGDFSLAGATLYASTEPCPLCLAAAHWARLDRVVHAADRADAAAIGFDDARLYRVLAGTETASVRLVRGDATEARAVMRAFADDPATVLY